MKIIINLNGLKLIPYSCHKCGTMRCVGKFLRTGLAIELINYGPAVHTGKPQVI